MQQFDHTVFTPAPTRVGLKCSIDDLSITIRKLIIDRNIPYPQSTLTQIILYIKSGAFIVSCFKIYHRVSTHVIWEKTIRYYFPVEFKNGERSRLRWIDL